MWRSVVAAVVVVVGSIALWVLTVSIAWNIGSWVGASESSPIPTIAALVAFSPSIINIVIFIWCIRIGIKRRASMFLTLGISSLVMAVFLYFITSLVLAFGSMT